MKKLLKGLICALVVLLIAVNVSASEEIVVKYTFEKPIAVRGLEGYDKIVIPELNIHAKPGEPLIPFKTAKIFPVWT